MTSFSLSKKIFFVVFIVALLFPFGTAKPAYADSINLKYQQLGPVNNVAYLFGSKVGDVITDTPITDKPGAGVYIVTNTDNNTATVIHLNGGESIQTATQAAVTNGGILPTLEGDFKYADMMKQVNAQGYSIQNTPQAANNPDGTISLSYPLLDGSGKPTGGHINFIVDKYGRPISSAGNGFNAPGTATAAEAGKAATDEMNQGNVNVCIQINRAGIPTGINFQYCAAEGADLLLQLTSYVLWAVALLFNYSLDYTLNFNQVLKNLPIVDVGWAVFRDVANIFFIFVMLFIAIGIILDTERFGGKKMLATVIITALLLNFSLFFTKVIIDVSNVTSLAFYAAMDGSKGTDGAQQVDGIAATLMRGLGLQTVFSTGFADRANSLVNAAPGATDANVTGYTGKISAGTSIIIGIGGSVLILVTSFVLLASIVLFMIRTVVLILLMILSPLAFVAQAIPGAQEYGKMWWKALINQCLFAPVYMGMMYAVISAITKTKSASDGGNFAAMFAGNSSAISAIFTFGLLITLMIAVLLVAAKIGAVGASGALSVGKNIQGALGAGLIGRYANRIMTSEKFKNSFLGRSQIIHGGLSNIANAKFGGKNSYADALAKRKKSEDAFNKYTGAPTQAQWKAGDTMQTFTARQLINDKNAKAREDDNKGVIRDQYGDITALKARRWSNLTGAQHEVFVENRNAVADKAAKKTKETMEENAKHELREKEVPLVQTNITNIQQKVAAKTQNAPEYKAAMQKVRDVEVLVNDQSGHTEVQAAQARVDSAKKHMDELRAKKDAETAKLQKELETAETNARKGGDPARAQININIADRKLKQAKENYSQQMADSQKDQTEAQSKLTEKQKEIKAAAEKNLGTEKDNLRKVEKSLAPEETKALEAEEKKLDGLNKKIKDHEDKIKKIKEGDPLADLKQSIENSLKEKAKKDAEEAEKK